MQSKNRGYRKATLAVREGQRRTQEGEHNDPLFLTSSFVFDNAEHAAARFAETDKGNVYSRFTNPTVETFEQRLAVLEGAEFCAATASGMGAVLTLSLALLKSGDHIVLSHSLFGSTINFSNNILSRFGVETTYVDLTDYEQWEKAVTPATRYLFIESPSNPLMSVADITRLAGIAHEKNALLVVDNVACTPALQQPLNLGADIVMHSATKYLDGQGRCVGGALVTNDAEIYDGFYKVLRTAGPSMSPFNAWVFLNGLETLGIRMQAHCENALALAQWLETHPQVQRVYYPGLPSHPQHELAQRQQKHFGAVVSFEVKGAQKQAWQVIDALDIFSITANLGDTKSIVTHPASTTHSRISAEERTAAGIKENLIRLSVGLEDIGDLKQDLEKALGAVT